VAWLAAEAERAGVAITLGSEPAATPGSEPAATPEEVVVECTGSRQGQATYLVGPDAVALDIAALRAGLVALPAEGHIVIFDPIGGPIAVALAEELGVRAVLVTQDNIAGNELSRTGDLAPANSRLQQQGVRLERRCLVREVQADHVVIEDRFSGQRRRIDASAFVDCGFRLPAVPLGIGHLQAGDCVPPRTIHEAILEGRRAAMAIDHV